MLILSRRAGESLVIGKDIAITVLAVKGNQVRIGVEAPKEVSVRREEIGDRTRERKESVAGEAGSGAPAGAAALV